MAWNASQTRVCYIRVEEPPAGASLRYTVVTVDDIVDRATEQTYHCPDAAAVMSVVAAFLDSAAERIDRR